MASRVAITNKSSPTYLNSSRFLSPSQFSNSSFQPQNAASNMFNKSVLVTGGAGYIGTHTVLQLLLGGFKTVVVDNLDNSSEVAIHRVKELAAQFGNNLNFHKVSCTSLVDLGLPICSCCF